MTSMSASIVFQNFNLKALEVSAVIARCFIDHPRHRGVIMWQGSIPEYLSSYLLIVLNRVHGVT
jgi:hypothetical protein